MAQAETVVGSSWAPHASLLISLSGSTGAVHVVHQHGLTGSAKPCTRMKADLAIFSHILGVLECIARFNVKL